MNNSIEEKIKKGEALFNSGKIQEAEECFQELVKIAPENAEVLNNLGVINHIRGDLHKSEDYLLRALAIKEDYLDALNNLGDLYLTANRVNEAFSQFEKYMSVGNQDPTSFYNQLGKGYLDRGKLEKAQAVLAKSLELNPDQQIVKECLSKLNKLAQVPTDLCHSGTIREPTSLATFPKMTSTPRAHPTDQDNIHTNRHHLTNTRIAIINTFDNRFNQIYASYFSKKNEVKVVKPQTNKDLLSVADWADIIWSTWCNEPLIFVSHQKESPVLVTHIRSYEILTPALMQNVQWQNLSGAIFVANHIREIANQFWKDQLISIPQTTVHNCVYLDEYPLYDNGPGRNIAYIGYLNHKKGIGLLLQCIQKALLIGLDVKFHIAGIFQEARFQVYMTHLLKEMGIEKHVVFHGWVQEVTKFLKDMNFVISTSPWEGCPNNIIEAMACGIKPVIHNWRGSKQLFPEELIFNSVDDFVSIISSVNYQPEAYRSHVEQHFNAEKLLPKIDLFLVEALARRKMPEQAGRPHEFSTQPSIRIRVPNWIRRSSIAPVDKITLGWVPFGTRSTASSRLRVYKIHDYLTRYSERYQSTILKRLDPSLSLHILILQRVYGGREFNALLEHYRSRGVKIILDLCDIYPEAKATAEVIDLMTTSTEAREKQLKELGLRCRCRTVDDAMDYEIEHCHPHPNVTGLRPVWFGTYSNVHLMHKIASITRAAAITSVNVKDKIPGNWDFIEWRYEHFADQLREFNVCLLPQEDDGKSPLKMIVAILLGLPVIASSISSYQKVARLTDIEDFLCNEDEDWYRALEILKDRENRIAYLEKSQHTLLQKYSTEAIVGQWSEVFEDLIAA